MNIHELHGLSLLAYLTGLSHDESVQITTACLVQRRHIDVRATRLHHPILHLPVYHCHFHGPLSLLHYFSTLVLHAKNYIIECLPPTGLTSPTPLVFHFSAHRFVTVFFFY